MTRLAWPLAAALILAACGSSPGPTSSAEPSVPASHEPALDPPATGPISELGEGPVLDTTWRYALYPSDEGPCALLEVDGTVATRCGALQPAEGEVFSSIGWASPDLTGLQALEGFVARETATVWLLGENGYRIPAILVSLDEEGIEQRGFIALGQEGVQLTHLQAIAMNGQILDTFELPPR